MCKHRLFLWQFLQKIFHPQPPAGMVREFFDPLRCLVKIKADKNERENDA